MKLFRDLTIMLVLFAFLAFHASPVCAARLEHRPGKLLQSMLNGPMAEVDEIVFATRVSGKDHWYVNFGYYCDNPTRMGFGEGGRLCRLNLRTGKLKVLLDDPNGGVRDPQVHYDGQKILFSYRKGESPTYHLYEINIDGSGLKQLTAGEDDDIEPTYLPDGGIMFCSSRCRRVVNCWLSRVATLYRCDGDGKNIRLVSSNNDHDNTPWVLPDGRVLYMRWEYVDRSQIHFHHLWTVNPDGTGQMVYFGNQHGGTTMIDAKPIPGTNKVVASFSPHHGLPEHMGTITIVDPDFGPDLLGSTKQVSRGNELYRDPYAISEDCFLAVDREGICVLDGKGQREVVYRLPKKDAPMECHEPRPLASRPRERVIPARIDCTKKTGHVVLGDIYHGRAMQGVRRGEIKKLLVLEQLPKPVNFSGGQEPISIGGTFTLARIQGTVPVEPDGSAYMELPASRSLFFVALDENDMSVKRMQSFVTLQPGEISGCVGCHEHRSNTPRPRPNLMAIKREPSRIEPIHDIPDVIDYPRDIQPIWNAHCVGCHNPDEFQGKVDLSGDHTPVYSTSYWTLFKRGLIADGRNHPYSQQQARSIGSSASRIMKLIDGSHFDAKLSAREQKLVRLWIDSSAAYPGTYAALGSGMYHVNLPLKSMQSRCGACHSVEPIHRPHTHLRDCRVHFGPKDQEFVPKYLASSEWQYPLVTQSRCNLTRPDKSMLLRAPLSRKAGGLGLCPGDVFSDTNDPDYKKLLASITAAAAELEKNKRFDMPGFRPNQHYLREMQRYKFLPKALGEEDRVDAYATDRAYWKSFWYRPPSRD